MKVGGKIISGPKELIIPIPREDGDIIFIARAILDHSDFDTMCPRPNPPITQESKTGKKYKDVEHPDYRNELDKWAESKTVWTILKSLSATDGLEWDTVNMQEPSTWSNFKGDLQRAGFNTVEIQKIIQGALDVNSLDESKMEEARARFLASRGAKDAP